VVVADTGAAATPENGLTTDAVAVGHLSNAVTTGRLAILHVCVPAEIPFTVYVVPVTCTPLLVPGPPTMYVLTPVAAFHVSFTVPSSIWSALKPVGSEYVNAVRVPVGDLFTAITPPFSVGTVGEIVPVAPDGAGDGAGTTRLPPGSVAIVGGGCGGPVTRTPPGKAGAVVPAGAGTAIGAGGFNPSWLTDWGAGGDGTAPPRTKFHEHVTVEVVPGGAPGKFADNPCGAEPVMLDGVAAPSITGNVHSST